MRVINTETLVPVVEQLCKKACYELNDNVMNAFREALKTEESPIGKESLEILIENGEFAKENQLPCCHDTGAAVVVLEIGQEVAWEGARECKIVCVNRYCMNLLYAPYWGKQR